MCSSRGHFICCQQIHRISIFSCQLELLAPALHTELDTEYLAASKPLVEKIHKILTRNERWAYFRSLKTSGYHWSEKVVYFIVFGKQLDNDWSMDSWTVGQWLINGLMVHSEWHTMYSQVDCIYQLHDKLCYKTKILQKINRSSKWDGGIQRQLNPPMPLKYSIHMKAYN